MIPALNGLLLQTAQLIRPAQMVYAQAPAQMPALMELSSAKEVATRHAATTAQTALHGQM